MKMMMQSFEYSTLTINNILYKIVISKMPIFSTKSMMTMQFMQVEFNQGATCCKKGFQAVFCFNQKYFGRYVLTESLYDIATGIINKLA